MSILMVLLNIKMIVSSVFERLLSLSTCNIRCSLNVYVYVYV